MRLSYKAASPNNRSIISNALLPALAFLLTSSYTLLLGAGLGVFIPAAIGLLYLLSATTSTNRATLLTPLPAVARAVYGTNLAIIASSILFIFQISSGSGEQEDGEKAMLEYYLSKDVVQIVDSISGIFADFFPLFVCIPLVLLGLQGISRPKSEEKATKYLKDNYLASEVAYGFERTWA